MIEQPDERMTEGTEETEQKLLEELSSPEVLDSLTPQQAAQHLIRFRTVTYAREHESGIPDQATAYHNIHDTAAGQPANRSTYGTAPGGSVRLSGRSLRALLALARDGYRFHVSEFAGGSHSASSRHYRGTAVDIARLGTLPVSSGNPAVRGFMQACRNYGAVELLGPGDAGHATHIHAAWQDS